MTREKYESLPLATLKELAKARKMRGVSTLKKSELIDAMLALDEQEEQAEAASEAKEEVREEMKEKKSETDIEQLDSGNTANGILEVMQDGFLRPAVDAIHTAHPLHLVCGLQCLCHALLLHHGFFNGFHLLPTGGVNLRQMREQLFRQQQRIVKGRTVIL